MMTVEGSWNSLAVGLVGLLKSSLLTMLLVVLA